MDEQFESQFTGSPLAEAMGKAYQRSKEWYLEYVTADHNHEMVSRISKSTALAMIESSPYCDHLVDPFQVRWADGKLSSVMNKGAVRITPSESMMERMALLPQHKDDWEDARPYEFGEDYRNEVWVYNHDGKYYITRPRKDV